MFVNLVLFISIAAFGVWSVLRTVYVNVCPLNLVCRVYLVQLCLSVVSTIVQYLICVCEPCIVY